MATRRAPYRRVRVIFLALFLVSTCLALVFGAGLLLRPTPAPPMTGDPGGETTSLGSAGNLLAAGASCLTSILTLLGFASTTVLAWRKETRDKEDRDLERKHKELELERMRLELERLRAEQERQSREGPPG